jgi:transposase InsO family protein
LQRLLARAATGIEAVPSERTIARVLKRTQMVRKRRYRPPSLGRPVRAPHYCVAGPNDLWTVDFKGWWCTGDGARCDPLTVRDAFSRYVFALRVVPSMSTEDVKVVFEELFARHGLPKAIQSDNGQPFACTRTIGGLTRLSAWWMSLGIELVRSRPGCPQDNGGHERMHADVCVELEAHAAASLELQQVACDQWRVEFNHVRPHEALAMRTPAEVYRPSERKMKHVVIGGYPEGFCLVRVCSKGCATYCGDRFFVTAALRGYQVGLQAVGQEVHVWFHDLLLGRYVVGDGRGRSKTTSVLPFDEESRPPQTNRAEVTDGVTAGVTVSSPEVTVFQTAAGTASPFAVDSPQTDCPPRSPAASVAPPPIEIQIER